jgi:competence protein ComEA
MRMPTVSRSRALLYLAVVLALLALAGHVLLGGAGADPEPAAAETLVPLPAGTGAAEEDVRTLLVHVVGAVRRPGLYPLEEGSRVDDAIRAAGGPRRRAALELVNLAAPVSDGQQVVVPVRASQGEALDPDVSQPAAAPGPVHLNTATLEELDSLPGVGPVTAQRILDYREKHGSFASVDELDAVSGIGPARLEQLRELVVP